LAAGNIAKVNGSGTDVERLVKWTAILSAEGFRGALK